MKDQNQVQPVNALARAAGNAVLLLILIQAVTGVIQGRSGGYSLMAVHHWSGGLVIIFMLIHLVLLLSSTNASRGLLWVTGMLLIPIFMWVNTFGWIASWGPYAGSFSETYLESLGALPGLGWIFNLFMFSDSIPIPEFLLIPGSMHVRLMIAGGGVFTLFHFVAAIRDRIIHKITPSSKTHTSPNFIHIGFSLAAFLTLFLLVFFVQIPLSVDGIPVGDAILRPPWHTHLFLVWMGLFPPSLLWLGALALYTGSILLLILPFIERKYSRKFTLHQAKYPVAVLAILFGFILLSQPIPSMEIPTESTVLPVQPTQMDDLADVTIDETPTGAAAEETAVVLNEEPTASNAPDHQMEIQPVFDSHCVACHTVANKSNNNYIMTDYDSVITGGDHAPSVMPGDIDSNLLKMVRREPNDAGGPMPPAIALDPELVNLLERWVVDGAPASTP